MDLYIHSYAAKRCYSLKVNGCNKVDKDSELSNKLKMMSPKSLWPVDSMEKMYIFEKKFSVPKVADQIMEVYKQALS